ncbi:putative glycoside hydrolase [Paenibacillus sp.]|uniref:putative glycoside hydrolase n=1 Tax=Paenibacillus sp. TaxID=58172 RepID=UPI002D756333|nr:putative glycoside hydrolase [Paenibacillus sp.]HZG56511.1 putative glycoside hydrolase [Paenibacillus sp.]
MMKLRRNFTLSIILGCAIAFGTAGCTSDAGESGQGTGANYGTTGVSQERQTELIPESMMHPAPTTQKGTGARDNAKDDAEDKSGLEVRVTPGTAETTPSAPEMVKSDAPPETAKAGPQKERRKDVKGVYVSAYALQGKKWNAILKLLEDTELNALVIDVKNDNGRVTYPSGVRTAKEIEADGKPRVKDMTAFLKPLKEKNTYLIGRIVTFKDPYLAAKKPEWAMKRKDGTVWRDKRGVSWVDPYNEEVWAYNIQLAEEAIRAGFDEIQFDYVRFPEQTKAIDREVVFHNPYNENKDQIIQRFLRTASNRIHQAGGLTSADVFGLTTTTKNGMGIGQKWELLTQEVDALSPMIYPSHYGAGSYGAKHPDLQPYRIVKAATRDAIRRNAAMQKNGEPTADIRPWLQDFTAKWIRPHQTYRKQQIREQIKALEEQGITQYLLWNPSSRYSM